MKKASFGAFVLSLAPRNALVFAIPLGGFVITSPHLMKALAILLINLFFLSFSLKPCHAGEKRVPFSPGEKLVFEVRWAFIPAAEGVPEILPMETVEGVRCYHFSMTARTYSLVDVFYKLRERIEGFTDEGLTRSILYKKTQDGRTKRRVSVNFDWEKLQAQYSNFDERAEPISILPGSFDPLSVFYALRPFHLKEGEEINATVTDGKKCIVGKAKVARRGKIKVRDTVYDTFLVEPDYEQPAGVFEKLKKAKIQVWVTADGASIPVRVKSEVFLGSFTAELVSLTRPPQ
jgi:hypothetical protein